jgi:pyridoxamine 5'-phosphate oxidase
MANISDLRKDYARASLEVGNILPDPIQQFNKWFSEAMEAEVLEANAMSLATCNMESRPSCRIVLLKGVEDNCFVFYTNFQSQKGKELEINPVCALTFFWPELERQVRIEGIVSRISEERSTSYFQSRPRGSQVSAWSSPQSSAIDSREILEERVAQMEARFKSNTALPKPKQWGGYQVAPTMVEFWQGRPNRLHDRLAFFRLDNQWEIRRLAP